MTASPWALLTKMPDVTLSWTTDDEILKGRRARWFPDSRRIFMDSRIRRLKVRCSLAHELGHVVLGHPASCGADFYDNRVEVEADQFAARLLMPDLQELGTELGTTCNHGHAAANLNVTMDMLDARLAGLTHDEQKCLKRIVWSIHEGAGA